MNNYTESPETGEKRILGLDRLPSEYAAKPVLQAIAGSKLYEMDTPDSDTDYRIIYKVTNPVYIYGLKEPKTLCTVSEEVDVAMYELSHFVHLMAKTNTQIAELIWMDEKNIIYCSDDFKIIRENKYKLLDSEKLFKSLCGYLHNERRLAMGERQGQLGGKRKEALEEYGFSYKNCVQFCRLSIVGAGLFLNGEYIVGMKDHPDFEFLMDIKLNPQKYTKEKMSILLDKYENMLFHAYENKRFTFNFDFELAGEILRSAYAKK